MARPVVPQEVGGLRPEAESEPRVAARPVDQPPLDKQHLDAEVSEPAGRIGWLPVCREVWSASFVVDPGKECHGPATVPTSRSSSVRPG